MIDHQDIGLAYAVLQAEVEPLLFLARDTGLQKEALVSTERLIKRSERERIAAIMAKDERQANNRLGLTAVVRALECELQMYISLKEDRPDQAWTKLIDAQDAVSAAVRASPDFTNLPAKFQHLRKMETWFFPPQVFMSAGLIVRKQRCSICQDDYNQCDHVAGRPYMGRFCTIELRQASPDHISFVEAPADRRCRITSFSDTGGTRNRMTWVLTPGAQERGSGEAIIATSVPEMDAADPAEVA